MTSRLKIPSLKSLSGKGQVNGNAISKESFKMEDQSRFKTQQSTTTGGGIQTTSRSVARKNTNKFFNLKKPTQESMKIKRELRCSSLYQQLSHSIINSNQQITLLDLFRNFTENYQHVVTLKNDKYAMTQLRKLAQYNSKAQELLEIFKSRLLNVSPEQLIKLVIMNWLEIYFAQDDRKFRMDPGYLTAMEEMTKRLEEIIIQIENDRINQMESNMLHQISVVFEMRHDVDYQLKLTPQQQQPIYERTLQLTKRDINYRVLTNEGLKKLELEEEKIGKFDLITNRNRKRNEALENFVQNLRYKSSYIYES